MTGRSPAGTTFSFRGRRPKGQVTPGYTLEAFTDFLGSNPVIGRTIAGIASSREEEGCAYTNEDLRWTLLIADVMRFPSWHQFDLARNKRAFSATVFSLSGHPFDPGAAELFTACSQTIVNMLKLTDPEELRKAQVELFRHFMRGRYFEFAKLNGHYCVAVDATVKDRVFSRASAPVDPAHRCRYVLEAKLITPWGWALSIVSEPIEPYATQKEKQDSEYAGFARLAKRLHEALPHCPLCIVGDALYHCQPVREVCRGYKWQFIFTAKEGRAPELYRAAMAEMDANPGQSAKVAGEGGGPGATLRWADGGKVSCEVDYDAGCDFVEVREDGGGYSGVFATSFEVKCARTVRLVADWGRLRWNIENSFKVMKHDGYGLGHTFCLDERVSDNMYLMMTIAHMLWQVFYSGLEPRLSERTRKPTRVGLAMSLRVAILTIGITSTPVDRGARFSRAYMDRWRPDTG